MEPPATYLADVAVGLVTTVVGILVVYALARPRVRLGKRVSYSVGADGSRRFRLFLSAAGWLPALNVKVVARLILRGTRSVSIPVPLSNDEYLLLRPRSNRVPRLLLSEIAWERYASSRVTLPSHPLDLEETLRELDAYLHVDLVASSGIFNVTSVRQCSYRVEDIAESPLDVRRRRNTPDPS